MTLYLSQKKLFVLLISALLIGFCLSFVYDGFRLLRTLRYPKRRAFRVLNGILISLEDFLFFTFGGAVLSILFYVTNSGKVRPSAFVMAIVGFWLFRVTLSRVTFGLLLRLLNLVKLPICWGLRFLGRLFDAVVLKFRRRKAKRFFDKIERMGRNGYGFRRS